MKSEIISRIGYFLIAFIIFTSGCSGTSYLKSRLDNMQFENDLKKVGEFSNLVIPEDYERKFVATTAYFFEQTSRRDEEETEFHKKVTQVTQYYLNQIIPNTGLFYTLPPEEFFKSYYASKLSHVNEVEYVIMANVDFFGIILGGDKIDLLQQQEGSLKYLDTTKSRTLCCSLTVSLYKRIGSGWVVLGTGEGQTKFCTGQYDYYTGYNKKTTDDSVTKVQLRTSDIQELDRLQVIKLAVHKGLVDLLPKVVKDFGVEFAKKT